MNIFVELAYNKLPSCSIVVKLRETAMNFEVLGVFWYYVRNEACNIAGQGYRKLYGRLYVTEVVSYKHERRIGKDEQC